MQLPREITWVVLKKLETELPYDPDIPPQGMFPEKHKINLSMNFLYFHVYLSIEYNTQGMDKVNE